MTKPSDKKPSGSTQGRSRASANKVDTTAASATETKKPASKTRTPAKKPAATAAKPAAKKTAATTAAKPAATKPATTKAAATKAATKAAPATEKAPRVSASSAAKQQTLALAPEAATTTTAASDAGQVAPKAKKPRISALAKKALADAQTARESHAAADDETSPPRDRNKIEGARLIKMIRKAIVERGLQDRTIADIVGVTQIYWNSLANGNRQIKSLGKEKLQKIAEFLGLPLIQIYILAEHFTREDFFTSKDLNEQLWLSIRKMQEDPQWAGYAPSPEEWEQTPINVRITLVSLYEREPKRYLMAKAEVEIPGNNFSE